jgi:hypothetical protein
LKKFALLLTALAVAFLLFLAGAITTRFEFFPYAYLRNAFAAADALFVQRTATAEPFATGAKPPQLEDLPSPPIREGAIGLGRYNPERAYDGLTFYTPIRANFPLRLIDMQGNAVHQWTLPFADLGGERDDHLGIAPDNNQYTVSYARVLPNGDLLAVLGTTQYTPWGVGIVKLDKDSRLIWKYTKQAHHDLDIGPDGKIYAMLHRVVQEPVPGMERTEPPFIDDQVVVLTPDGKELQVVSILQSILDSPYQSILQFADPEAPKGDFLHLNSVKYLDAGMASKLPYASAGDVLISLRQIDVLAVLDLRERKIKWAIRGPWHHQHDPDLLPNGNMLVFSNRGDLRHGGTSRVLEFNPFNLEILWEYPGNSGERLYTSIYGSQQRLPNGNTLISESNNGRLLEVTRDKEVVWEYRIPERKVDFRGNTVATVVFGQRFSREELPFLDELAGRQADNSRP